MSDDQKVALIIEDDPQSAEIFEAAVQEAGYKTERYYDGQVALDRLQQYEHIPFLVVLDMHLPNVPGDKILDYIVSDEKLSELRIIIASADGHLAGYQQRKKDGNILILHKPVSFSQLRSFAMRLNR